MVIFGLLTVSTILILSPGELHRTPPREQLAAEWCAAHQRQLSEVPGMERLIEDLLEADGTDLTMDQAKALLQAGFKLKAGHFGLADPTTQAVCEAQEEARRIIARVREKLGAARTATRARFVAALRACFLEPLPEGLTPEARDEVERLVRIISRFDTLTGDILSLRNQVTAFDLLLRNMPKDGNNAFFTTARGMGASMRHLTTRLLEATAGLEYPFDHARGKVLLCDFLVESAAHSDESIHAFLRAQTLLNCWLTFYYRLMGRLALRALQAEQNVLSESVPPVAQPEVSPSQT